MDQHTDGAARPEPDRRAEGPAGESPVAPAPPGEPAGLPPDVAVLWRRPAPGRRGPRPSLSLDGIADAGVALADAEGLEAVSMARVAQSLGFTTMSLYRHVRSKDELLMLMVDRAAGPPTPVGPEAGDWRARLETLLEAQRPTLAAHPWFADLPAVLFALGPNRLAWMDAMLACLEDTQVPEAHKVEAVGVLASHQLDWARLESAYTARQRQVAAAGGGQGDPDALIARLVSPDEHPALARAVAGGAFDRPAGEPTAEPTDRAGLDFGTTMILDGIAALVARSARP
ncbi:TetR/AcrR family transcriptional regulator [Cellulomonas shaoxiangyii]|uniref:TetR/AcrR family transcriptional regulator n=1 Tax=Cellulomonas shaoxiangyii TaxID=2566013 RepID=A0A4P7SFI0_9CELL|nr:TetR/AcrR family transcriptional regulator [Cellulomonas shaoxiangyii]QCB92257.1 TetR/AcrR family transcriptional regulator [Cellulomonas shaoxiangyii]TGY85931.1 TetR/AcrR family transcriptional regulator [Cellulomonas shaoxiangyii]